MASPSLSLDELLEHHGVKGMHWGIRKEDSNGINRLVVPAPKIDPSLAKSTQAAGKEVAALMAQRYGYRINEVKGMSREEEANNPGIVGFVRNTPGTNSGVIETIRPDLRKMLKEGEDIGWFGEGMGTPKAFMTHESAHAFFHAEQKTSVNSRGVVTKTGGHHEARDKALAASLKQAKKDGIPIEMFGTKISGYTLAAGMREETEGELFSQYHWSPNPPKFVQVWGQTLHKEMGIDPTPFREVGHGG